MLQNILATAMYKITFFLFLKNRSAKKAPTGMDKIGGVSAAMPINPKRCFIRITRRLYEVNTFFWCFGLENHRSLNISHHFIMPSLKYVNTIALNVDPANKVSMAFKNWLSNAAKAAGTPSFEKKMVLAKKTDRYLPKDIVPMFI